MPDERQQGQPAGTLTLRDVVQITYSQSMRIIIAALLFVGVAILGIVFALLLDQSGTESPWWTYGFLLCWGLVMLAVPYVSATNQFRKQRYLREPIQFSFSETAIRLEGPNFSSQITWQVVQRVRETKSAFLIFQSARAAWILPKRFFANNDDIEKWRQFAIAHLEKPNQFRPAGWLSKRF
ncbi:MAG TPA: YcxB family protein [Bryobacteraceae bacterium]|jgi:hypothetical protein|nr:YcxB family protein [Bryobacteraceae bacterium]